MLQFCFHWKAAPNSVRDHHVSYIQDDFLLHKRACYPHRSGAGLLIGPYDAVIRRWRCLCDIVASQTGVSPEGVGPGSGPWRSDHGSGRAVGAGGCGAAGQGAVVSFLRLAGDLAALDQWVESGGPETVLATQQVGVIDG